MADVITKKAKSPNACCNCSKSVGDAAKVMSVSVLPADGEGELETWCPTCFVYHRAPLEQDRWGVIFAAKCGRCGVESLLHGHANACSYCRSSAVVLLPPNPSVIASA